MGYFNSVFNLSNFGKAYNGVKNGISAIYHPIKKLTNGLSDYAHKIDNFISKGRSIPVLRDVVNVLQDFYNPALDVVDAVNTGVNLAGQAGERLSNVIEEATGMRKYQEPTPAEELNNPYAD